jgi:hypothetical protein
MAKSDTGTGSLTHFLSGTMGDKDQYHMSHLPVSRDKSKWDKELSPCPIK